MCVIVCMPQDPTAWPKRIPAFCQIPAMMIAKAMLLRLCKLWLASSMLFVGMKAMFHLQADLFAQNQTDL